MEYCRDCKYYKASPEMENRGNCRRNPPQVVFYSQVFTKFPSVASTEWCGEFKHKDDEGEYPLFAQDV